MLLTRGCPGRDPERGQGTTICGLEVDLEARPVDEWLIHGSLGLMHNEFDDWSDDIGDYTRSQDAQRARDDASTC